MNGYIWTRKGCGREKDVNEVQGEMDELKMVME